MYCIKHAQYSLEQDGRKVNELVLDGDIDYLLPCKFGHESPGVLSEEKRIEEMNVPL